MFFLLLQMLSVALLFVIMYLLLHYITYSISPNHDCSAQRDIHTDSSL